MAGVGDLKDKLNGWHIVILVALILGTAVALVRMGETLGAVVAAALAILAVLGYNTAQNKTNNELANGRLTALQQQIAELIKDHSEEMVRKDQQAAAERALLQRELSEAHDKAAAYAALVPPDPKVTEPADGMASL
jgi:hypothetical protein